ncbi:hypothetical protein cand_028920 [Cryptosporidium andersoni]|uniref:Eukaryotic translation initiation factor 2A n=1 Tax=Cryptosporidium andersoni TaxID=117008 RepID=A0A1J4MP87_9CRYT|nr:hypothetical protein cand_028920 [Cryptosporidium andersoni]
MDHGDEVICLGKGGVYKIRGITSNKSNENIIEKPIPYLPGVEIYTHESQGRGYCYVPAESKNSVIIVTDEMNKILKVEGNFPVRKLQYSPLGSYLLILTVYEQGKNEDNLCVYKLGNELKLLFSFPFRTNSAKVLSTWPPYRWSNNELWAFKVQDTCLSIYDGHTESLDNPIETLTFNKSIQLSLSSEISNKQDLNNTYLNFAIVAYYSNPNVDIYIYHIERNLDKISSIYLINNKELSEVQQAQLSWNYNATSLLVFTQVEGETLGKSYFGSSSLHLFRINNTKTVMPNDIWSKDKTSESKNNISVSNKYNVKYIEVVSSSEGPVNDVAWSPIENEFLLCKGVIPPELTLNSGYDGSPKLSFGRSRRNTIRWNPSGKWFAYGGFGNLAGELDIWDVTKQKLIGQTNASCCITLEWSFGGRYLLASTTSPRLRVDNAIRVFRYNGDLLGRIDFDTLYSAFWTPSLLSTRGNIIYRSVSPGREFKPKVTPEKQVYRPRWATSDFAERMRVARGIQDVSKDVNNQRKSRSEYIIPGLPTLEASIAATKKNGPANFIKPKNRFKKKIEQNDLNMNSINGLVNNMSL